jgi:hypothetical protein
MSTRAQALDHLYGDESPETWAEILGPELHYHFGTYEAEEDLEQAARATIRRFYPDIPDGASVLDAGCGWGGPARMLESEKGCTVRGITVSRTQAEHGRRLGLQVDELDLETATLSGRFDVAFMCESLDHIQDKLRVLRQLRAVATRLIVRVSAISPVEQAQTRGQPSAMLLDLATPVQLEAYLRKAGWRILKSGQRRRQAMRTFLLWRANLDRVYGTTTAPGHLESLRRLCSAAVTREAWFMRAYPLIDVVAE